MATMPELGVGASAPGRRGIPLAQEAEQRGFDSLWAGDANGSDALTSAAVLAAVTTKPKIGTAVALRVRTPLQTMFACNQLEELTGGRFVFGIGAGPAERIEGWHGLEHNPAVGRMREYITVLQKLWASSPASPVDYEGRFYKVENYGRPAPANYALPIYIGCAGALMTRLAGEIADGLIVHVLHSKKMVREQMLPNLQVGAKRGKRSLTNFKLGAGIFTAVDDDYSVALNRARHQIIWALTVPYNKPLLAEAGYPDATDTILGKVDSGDIDGALAAIPEDLVHELTLCGTPNDVRSQLVEWGDVVNFVTLNGVGAYMNVVSPELRLPFEELEKNRTAIYNLRPMA